MLVDVFAKGMLGSEAEKALGEAAITVNKNAIPFDTNPPMKPSGIRIGTPALTTRGMKEKEMRQVGRWISEALHHRTETDVLAKIRRQVLELAEAFPLYAERRAKAQPKQGEIEQLKRLIEIQSQIVELRYFGGLTVEETAEFLKLSQRTVEREWTAAKAWLYRELSEEET